MKPLLRTIFVGVGRRGRWPLMHANKANGFEPVALVDLNPAFIEDAQKTVGEVPGFSTLEAALSDVETDAVIICTPTVFHVPLAKVALAAGCATLVEKGMAPDLAKARELVVAAKESGNCLSVYLVHCGDLF